MTALTHNAHLLPTRRRFVFSLNFNYFPSIMDFRWKINRPKQQHKPNLASKLCGKTHETSYVDVTSTFACFQLQKSLKAQYLCAICDGYYQICCMFIHHLNSIC